MGSWAAVVVMMCVGGSREPMVGAMECDIVDSIMRADRDGSVGVVTGGTYGGWRR